MLTAENILNSLNKFNSNRGIKFKIVSDEASFIKSFIKLTKIVCKIRNMNYTGRKMAYEEEDNAISEFKSKIEVIFL